MKFDRWIASSLALAAALCAPFPLAAQEEPAAPAQSDSALQTPKEPEPGTRRPKDLREDLSKPADRTKPVEWAPRTSGGAEGKEPRVDPSRMSRLDQPEAEGARRTLRGSHYSTDVLRALSKMDKDGDGEIDAREYTVGGSLNFRRADRDGDGVLNLDELSASNARLDRIRAENARRYEERMNRAQKKQTAKRQRTRSAVGEQALRNNRASRGGGGGSSTATTTPPAVP